MAQEYKCPCCGNTTLGQERCYEICLICWWEDDPSQFEDPDYKGGANQMSLNEYKKKYSEEFNQNREINAHR